jgi:dTDP-4-dehydrorhamnose 3,5-epimerase
MINYIQGGIAKDHRGQIRFVNEFDMSLVKRFYIIKNKDLELVRGWRAHRIEQRWFYILHGSLKLDLVKIDNWDKPSQDLDIVKIILEAKDNKVLHVPAGYGTAFQALEKESEILVFADHHLDHASMDDYTYDMNYFLKRTS